MWSSYKRKQVNIEKSISNDEVSYYMQQHYNYLHSLLIKNSRDEDTFNDTFLKLTYNYNPEKDFIDQFKYYFNLLKGAYYRDDKVANYYLDIIDDYTPVDKGYMDEDITPSKQQHSLNDLKNKIHYAISKEKAKRTYKKD